MWHYFFFYFGFDTGKLVELFELVCNYRNESNYSSFRLIKDHLVKFVNINELNLRLTIHNLVAHEEAHYKIGGVDRTGTYTNISYIYNYLIRSRA